MKRYEIRICNLNNEWFTYEVEARSMMSAEDIAYNLHMGKGGILRVEASELK